MPLVEALAKAIGGEVAATRAVVDAGWVPYSMQVGQTGKTVSPKLYIACGVSGAIQHKVGMSNAGTIVAINKDANAPIHEFADVSVIGDALTIIPKLTEALNAQVVNNWCQAPIIHDLRLMQARRPERQDAVEHRTAAWDAASTAANQPHMFEYSGPLPPSGGVKRPPLAVIAPH